MRLKTISRALLVSALMLVLPAIASAAGHIAPVGLTTAPASQLIAWYDESEENSGFEGFSVLQVTNLSVDTAVNIHVQIFADDIFDNTNRCREHNFTDTLTPTDTVIYCIGNLNLDDDPNDVDGISNRLQAKGYEVATIGADHPYRKTIYFIDPAGFEFEFIQYLSVNPEEKNMYGGETSAISRVSTAQ